MKKTAYTREEVVELLTRTLEAREWSIDLILYNEVAGRVDDTILARQFAMSTQEVRNDDVAYRGALRQHKRMRARYEVAEKMLEALDGEVVKK